MAADTNNDPRLERLAALLIAGASISTAADELGVSVRTARRWRHDPQVAEALAEFRQASRTAVIDRLGVFVDNALSRAEALLQDPHTPPGVIARLLGLALAESRLWADHSEILERLERLELVAMTPDGIEPLELELGRHE
jgi:hypothetical protein